MKQHETSYSDTAETWADHGIMGLYIGPEMHHFRNYCCYIPTTIKERSINTVELFPAHVDMPKTLSEDRLTQFTQDLFTVLKNPHPWTPFLDQGYKTIDDIKTTNHIWTTPTDDTSETASPPRVTVNSNQAPRVLQSDVARQQSPRVAKMETRKANDIIKSGTQVRKKTSKTIHSGTVINYNKDTKKYTIQ